ncbi:MAG: cytochrome c [Roseovarius sp.]
MTRFLVIGALAAGLAGAAVYIARTGSESASGPGAPEGAAIVEVALPDTLSQEAKVGKQAFEAVCAECHGSNAVGREGAGPPLVHEIYEPSHHGDMAFHMAVQNGVRAHHWRFGDMPPQEGLTRADVDAIITYVRELQLENGIN